MTYKIFVRQDPKYDQKIIDLKTIANKILQYLHADPGDLSLVLADNETIQKLNEQFAGVNRPTDVLSFQDGNINIETGKIYYGDVILSIPYAIEHAQEGGHSLKDELTLLILHGILHLLGYDHSDHHEQEEMWSLQDEVLTYLGSKITSPR